MRRLRSLARPALLCAGLLATLPCSLAGTTTNQPRFGFRPVEIFPVGELISSLLAADFDGDGLNDLVVGNNLRSRVNLLYNQSGRTNAAAGPPRVGRRDVNELPPGARFRLESIPAEKRIAALAVGDFNGDGAPDLASLGEPKELAVQPYLRGTGWGATGKWRLEDAQLSANALLAADLNQDGRSDLVVLAENSLYLLLQTTNGALAEPRKLPTSGPAGLALIADLDADGRHDLLLVNWDSPTPLRFRRQSAAGQWGPEIFCAHPAISALCLDRFEGGREAHLVTISRNAGRAALSRFQRQPSEPLAGTLRQGQFSVLPLPRTEKARRGALWADLDGDGRAELIVAEPENGQVSVHFQEPDGSLGAPRTFPSLSGVTDLAAADWDGDGRNELFLLSPDERQVGVTRLEGGDRLPFPTLIPTEGKPLVMAVGALTPGRPPVLAVIVDREGRRSLLVREAGGTARSQPLNDNFKANPSELAVHDADADGLPDLVALVPFEKVKVLRQVAGKDFAELDVSPPGGVLEQPWLSRADVDNDGKSELLLAQKNFLRAVVLEAEERAPSATNDARWVFRVKEQINGAASNSRLVAAAPLPQANGVPALLLLLDAERKAITLCERGADAIWRATREVPLPLADFRSLQPLALGGTQVNTLTLASANAVGLLALSGDVWTIAEVDSYETPVKDGVLRDVLAGDLNHDGRKDLVFLEVAKSYVDVVELTPERRLAPGTRWPVFEERSYRGRRSVFPEPREGLIADVTGDGKEDLLLLVHDRILLYAQE